MKIGIITVQKAPNYGAVLQCYALQRYLKLCGYDTEVIDLCRPFHKEYKKTKGYCPYKIKKSLKSRFIFYIRSLKNKYFPFITKHGRQIISYKKRNKKEIKKWNDAFDNFNSHIVFSKKYSSIGELYNTPPQYDIYITGSDQLWNPTQNYCIEPFFLTFVKNGGRKVSYATSIGQDSLPKEVKEDYEKWINQYDFISLREQSGINLMQPLCKRNIYKTVDPTMLLPIEEWQKIAVLPKEDEYIFCFTLNYCPELLEYAKVISSKKRIKLIFWKHCYLEEDANLNDNCIGRIDISPEEWLGYIYKAKYIITNSFHGTLFSILFEKNFITYIPKNSTRGSRILDLLKMLDLEDRLLENLCVYDELILPDYSKVRLIISEEKNKSFNFLNIALK